MRSTVSRLYEVIRDHLGLNVSWVDRRLTRRIFQGRASVRRCNGRCCAGGATVSLAERDRVLAHAHVVAEAMTSRARRRPDRWFGTRTARDEDFTAGRTTETRVLGGACVFYRSDGLCALQIAGQRGLGAPYALKPAVCILWPLCVQDRTLQVGYSWFTRRRECCAAVRTGRRTALDVVAPDGQLIAQLTRPEWSRGGGPPGRS